MALQLRHIFDTYGKIEPAKDKPKEAEKAVDERGTAPLPWFLIGRKRIYPDLAARFMAPRKSAKSKSVG
jgi:hypothetical protein